MKYQKYISCEDIKDFCVGIEDGYLMWQCKLFNNDTIYQIKYRIEPYTTPKGNKSKRKIYFISIDDNEELVFDEELKKRFRAFRQPYYVSGI